MSTTTLTDETNPSPKAATVPSPMTFTTNVAPSPATTLADVEPSMTDKEAQHAKPKQLDLNSSVDQHAEHPLAQLGNARKNFLLVIFAIATFVDVCNVSGVAVAVAEIGQDTGLAVSQLVWVSISMICVKMG